MAAEDGPAHGRARIRSLVASDAEAVSHLFRTTPAAAKWSATDVIVLAESSGGVARVCEVDRQVVGALLGRAIADEAEILNVAVVPEQRRKGYARELVEGLLAEWREQGVERVYLEVRESNTAAQAFYSSLGFQMTGSRPNYYRNPTESASLMELVLVSRL